MSPALCSEPGERRYRGAHDARQGTARRRRCGGRGRGRWHDRDLGVRVIATGRNPAETKVDEIMSRNPTTIGGLVPMKEGKRERDYCTGAR
jgi:hypothetical protein